MEEREESPIEAALDLCVYAPLGFALEARNLLPRFVERGRNQVGMARVVGKFAVEQGRRDVEGRVSEGHAAVMGLLRLTGVLAPDGDGDGDGGGSRATSAPSGPVATPVSRIEGGRRGAEPTVVAERSAAATPVASAAPAPPVASLAIHGYESLSASQVVPRLDSLTATELEDVRRYEQANRGRKTILGKIQQLQSA